MKPPEEVVGTIPNADDARHANAKRKYGHHVHSKNGRNDNQYIGQDVEILHA